MAFDRHLVIWIAMASCAASAQGQWSFETADSAMQSRAAGYIGVAADGMVAIMYSGSVDGYSCDGAGDVYIKVRLAANNWMELPASYTPSRLHVTRPFMVMDSAGNIYVVYELRWAYYTGMMKFARTGPTTWVRDGDPILIKSPGALPCGANDPNLPNNGYLYGYNPRMAVGVDGGLHVIANHDDGCAYSYNSGANWRTGWSTPIYFPRANGSGVVTDDNGDAHLGMTTSNEDPNLNDNYYAKIHNGAVVVGPLVIPDGGARTGKTAIAANGTTAILFAMEWNYPTSPQAWNGFVWQINGTQVSGPTQVTSSGLDNPGVVARSGFVRYYYLTGAADARWAWWFLRSGYPAERFTGAGHDVGQAHMVMDSAGNVHGVMLDWFDNGGPNYNSYVYFRRTNDEPPPGGPRGTVAGTVRDQLGAPVANVAVSAGTAGITTSAANGSYSLKLPVQTHALSAAKTFYTTTTVPGIVVQENQTTSLDLVISGTPPAPVAGFTSTPGNTKVQLTWSNPGSPNYTGTMIRWKLGGYPLSPSDGTLLADNTALSVLHSSLTNGTAVYYAAFAYYQDASRYYTGGVVTTTTPFGPGDFDHDGDVDQSDFGAFQRCLSGPAVPQTAPECQAARFDDDDDVDLNDFGAFQACVSGAGIAANPRCLDAQ